MENVVQLKPHNTKSLKELACKSCGRGRPIRMYQLRYLWLPALVLFITMFLSQKSLAQPMNWSSPIDGEVLLSGTFGELRGNHYHGGTDIKPNVAGEQEILAVADGFVKEIRVRGGSYGNALLLQHKDGYQSLYGHLDHFIPGLDSMVYQAQYANEQFEVTLELDSTQFPVTQGMVISIMGNTGYSFGRHLHFEVRHPSGTIYNPLLVIPDLKDDTPPQFRNLKINYHDDHGREFQEKIVGVGSLGGGRYTAGDLTLNSFKYALGVDVVDLHKKTYNRNGIYSLEMYLDSALVYKSVFDSLSVEDRKYYPEHIDYITSPASQRIYHNLRYSSGNIFAQLKDPDKGLVRPYPFQTQNYTVKATDYQGNSSTLTFSVQRVENPSIDYAVMYNYMIKAARSNRINLDHFSMIFPEGTFLRDQRLYLFEEEVVHDNEKTFMVHMTENQLPLYQNPLLIMKSSIPMKDMSQWTLARCDDKDYKAITTLREKDQFAARISRLADYCLMKDTLPPDIKYLPQNNSLWYFTLSDNMHSFSSLEYSATVDGNWTLVKADNKYNRLIFRDFKKYRDGDNHQFSLVVKDACGNKAVVHQSFK